MKAMIFAAGIGSRLLHYTKNKPKALVEIAGKPMLEWLILKMINEGITEIVINIHHFANQISEFIQEKNNFGISIKFSHETGCLLNTGGGLKKASNLFINNEPILLHNVDVFANLSFKQMLIFHQKQKAMASLFVQNRNTSRYLLFNKNYHLSGWQNVQKNEKIILVNNKKLIPLAFNGIHIIEPSLINQMNEQGSFSIIDAYLRLAGNNKIIAYNKEEVNWIDTGKVEVIEQINADGLGFVKKYIE